MTAAIDNNSESNLQARIEQEQVKALYDNLNLTAIISVINAAILAFVVWEETDRQTLLIWLSVTQGLSVLRLADLYLYRSKQIRQISPAWRFNLGTLFSGVSWGSSALLIIPNVAIEYQLFIALILAGNCAGAASTFSHTRTALYAFIVPITVPFVFQFLRGDTQIEIAVGILGAIFFGAISAAGLRNFRNTKQNIELKLQANSREKLLAASEARYRSLLNSAADTFLLHDKEGRILDVNKSAITSLGYSREELLNMRINDIEIGIQNDILPSTWATLTQGDAVTVSGLHRRKDGSTLPVELKLTLITEQEKPLILALSRDVTERKRYEDALKQAHDEAQQASRAKSEFLSRMSHELRTPMNIILGFAQLLELEELTHEQKENIHEILRAGNHLLELINEILDLSRVEAGKLSISIEPVSLSLTIEDILQALAPLVGNQLITLSRTIDGVKTHSFIESQEIYVLADKTRLRQVIFNLLSNAIKYNQENGQIIIDVTSSDTRVCISISDSGNGIAKQDLPSLFKPFNRLNAEHSNIEGTGIGLVITKRLIELMQGEIGVESEEGKGSTFWFELPRSDAAEAHTDQTSRNSTFNSKTLQGRILYIDDNSLNIFLVRKYLTKFSDLEVLSAENALEGIEKATNNKPDLILLDINLPEISGFEVFKRLRNIPETKDIPIIALSANALPSQIQKAMDCGFDDYLTKPVDLLLLEKTLERKLRHM
ncbi:MAG: ATP-binding protein [Gammaproteobacteria bacterium]|nr:ATP-binding protein [Gammaproteobacteria bacterium]